MLSECQFVGPALTPGFATQALLALLSRHGLYPDDPVAAWRLIHRGLQDFAAVGGPTRVLRHIVTPLTVALGYTEIHREAAITTREGAEDGGYSFLTPNDPVLGAKPWALPHFFLAPIRPRGLSTSCAVATRPFRAEPSRA